MTSHFTTLLVAYVVHYESLSPGLRYTGTRSHIVSHVVSAVNFIVVFVAFLSCRPYFE